MTPAVLKLGLFRIASARVIGEIPAMALLLNLSVRLNNGYYTPSEPL